MKTKILFLIFVSFSTSAFAQECSSLSAIETLKCLGKDDQGISPNVQCAPECEEHVKKLTQDGTINITMAGGYFDADGDSVISKGLDELVKFYLTYPCPYVYEPTDISKEKFKDKDGLATISKLKEQMAKGCGKNAEIYRSCGFTQSDDPEIFEKKISLNGKVVAVRLKMTQPALTDSDKKNRENRNQFIADLYCPGLKDAPLKTCITKNSPPTNPASELIKKCKPGMQNIYQVCKSEHARKTFLKGITDGDEIIVFNGHARKGGGPSFDPPKVLANGHPDYDWYMKNREGHKQETEAFRTAVKKGKAPVAYVSGSCNGKRDFYDKGNFPEASPSTVYTLSNRTSFAMEAVSSVLTNIEGNLRGMCGKKLNDLVQGVSCAFNNFGP